VHFAELDAALREVPDLVRPGDVVLVKGSRRAGLERLVERLVEVHREDAA
jgi:UDP-N-acetylmuramyl pentapeptide synthase